MLEAALGFEDEDDEDEDDWETAGDDLDVGSVLNPPTPTQQGDRDALLDQGWSAAIPTPPPAPAPAPSSSATATPMIIVNLTKLTQGAVHNRSDPHSNNDPVRVSALRKEIEGDYDRYERDAEMIKEGVVVPAGGSVWVDAVRKLKQDHPGNFFLPIFKKS